MDRNDSVGYPSCPLPEIFKFDEGPDEDGRESNVRVLTATVGGRLWRGGGGEKWRRMECYIMEDCAARRLQGIAQLPRVKRTRLTCAERSAPVYLNETLDV
ncbi:hypothetical protein M413DRAFT_439014 [Hebeloma cylindrosporum]|uniref:Uncharacterized protein n=1 Tax=Hebeloma cylindrosporum TaxID=76867 RepID=A0A0C3D169_HEBCY|nr:hypothetical protein M413DRAFT_439014 [Hebeloma cylindrosporum h7]